jgi:hypothetical protein
MKTKKAIGGGKGPEIQPSLALKPLFLECYASANSVKPLNGTEIDRTKSVRQKNMGSRQWNRNLAAVTMPVSLRPRA